MLSRTRDTVQKALPLGGLALIFLLGALTLSPFLPALLWALFISVAILPFHTQLVDRLGQRRALATGLTAIGLILVSLVPMLILLRSVVALLPELAIAVANKDSLEWIGFDLPAGTSATWRDLWLGLRDDLEALRTLIGDDLRLLLSTMMFEGRLIGYFVLELLLGLIISAIILHNSRYLSRLANKAALKLGGERVADLGVRSVQTIRYTVLGVLGSAAVQAGVAAFAYWLVEAPHWPLLAFATFMLGLLQVGPVLIWAPMAVWLWMNDQTGMAIFLVLWGLFAVGLSDNLVKALVVSRGANLPTILVFLGAVGGLFVWGVVGVFLGPVILALCLELILWWLGEERSEDELQAQHEKDFL